MAMGCGSRQLETTGYGAVAATARRCRHGLFTCVKSCHSLWWTRKRGAAQRHVAISAVRLTLSGETESSNAVAFDLQRYLNGELIELRPLARAHWNELFLVDSDARIWEQHPE